MVKCIETNNKQRCASVSNVNCYDCDKMLCDNHKHELLLYDILPDGNMIDDRVEYFCTKCVDLRDAYFKETQQHQLYMMSVFVILLFMLMLFLY
jgi:hypothetical protein